MNQKVLAGIGNTYSDEILFQGPTPPKGERRAPRRPDPRKAPHRGPAAAEGDDKMGSQSAQVTGLLPALPQAQGREVPARQWQDPEDQSRRTNRLLLPCMPTEGEVTRKWPEKRNGRSSRNNLSRSSARSRFSGKVLLAPGSP